MRILALLLLVVPLALPAQSTRGAPPPGTRFFEYVSESCWNCHGPASQNGGLRLDLVEDVLDVVTPKKVTKSELFARLVAVPNSKLAMPPDGPPPPDDVVMDAVRWINSGADPAPLRLRIRLAAATGEARQRLADATRAVVVEGREEGTLRIDWSRGQGPVAMTALLELESVADAIAEISLAGRETPWRVLRGGPSYPNLHRLDVSRTTLDTQALKGLLGVMPGLTELVAHGTKLDDAAVDLLIASKQLKRVWLADSGISKEGFARLRKARADLEVTGPLSLGREAFARGSPRRILVLDGERRRLALLRERALSERELVWEMPIAQPTLGDLHRIANDRVLVRRSTAEIVTLGITSGEVIEASSIEGDLARWWPDASAPRGWKGMARLGPPPGEAGHDPKEPRGYPWALGDEGAVLWLERRMGYLVEHAPGRELRVRLGVYPDDLAEDAVHLGGFCADGEGGRWVSEGHRLRLSRFSASGSFVEQIDLRGERERGLVRLGDVRRLSTGNLFVTNERRAKGGPWAIEVRSDGTVVQRLMDDRHVGRDWLRVIVIEDDRVENRGVGR